MLIDVKHGDDFRRFEVVDVLSDLLCAPWGFQHLYVPPVEVFNDSDGHLARLVDEDVNVKAILHPFKVVERHRLHLIARDTPRWYSLLFPE